jgi:uncharacterized repeat protein (TIGR01451 family)
LGFGFGCTNNECLQETYNNETARSVVWVTPVEDADFYVDYQNDGVVDKTYQVNYLDSQVILDKIDKDMSGAIIFATKSGSGPTGTPVNFAAAWGQDPDKSGNSDESALDLGTLVVPFTGFQASKIVSLVDDNDNDGQISSGDKIKYTIVASNVGQQDIPTGGVTIKDTLDPDVSYVPDSMRYEVPETGESAVISGSSFLLASDGLPSQFPFLKRGGTAEISFDVTINEAESINKDTIYNEGTVTFGTANVPFRLELRLAAEALIAIEKTVYMGHGDKCHGNDSEDNERNGNESKDNQRNGNGSEDNDSEDNDSEDNESKNNKSKNNKSKDNESKDNESKDNESKDNESKDNRSKDNRSKGNRSKGNRSKDNRSKDNKSKDNESKDNESNDNESNDNDSEDSVRNGNESKANESNGNECKGIGSKFLAGKMDDEVTFSFKVTNSGKTCLANVVVKDRDLDVDDVSIGALAPGETKTVFKQSSMKGEQMSMAEATGIPVYPGTQMRLPGTSAVKAEDDAGVEIAVAAEEEAEYLCL